MWIYLDSSTGFTYTGSPYIFTMQSSFGFVMLNDGGEIGCLYNLVRTASFSTFVSHFPSYTIYDNWQHLSCVFNPELIEFFYNELYHKHSVATLPSINPQAADERFSFGFPNKMPISIYEARMWRSARSHGEILKYMYR